MAPCWARGLRFAFSQDFRPGLLSVVPPGTFFVRSEFLESGGPDCMPPTLRKVREGWGTLGCGGAGEQQECIGPSLGNRRFAMVSAASG